MRPTLFFTFLFTSINLLAMSEVEIVKRLSENSFPLKQARENLEKTQNQVKEARSSLFPVISISASKLKYEYPTYKTPANSIGITMTQTIYNGGKVFSALDLAKVSLESAKLQLTLAKDNTKAEAISYLLRLRNRQEKYKSQIDALQLQKRNLNIVREKLKFGNAKDYELEKAKADLLAREFQVASSKMQFDALKSEIELKAETSFSEVSFNSLKVSAFEKIGIDQALINSTELQIARSELLALNAQNRFNEGSDRPSINLVANRSFSSTSSSDVFESENATTYYGVSAEVPLFSGLSSVYKKKANANSLQFIVLKIHNLEREMRSKMINYLNQLPIKENLVKQNKLWLDSSKRALDLAEKSYRNARVSFLQLLQIQQAYDQAVSAYWDSLLDYETETLNYKITSGTHIF